MSTHAPRPTHEIISLWPDPEAYDADLELCGRTLYAKCPPGAEWNALAPMLVLGGEVLASCHGPNIAIYSRFMAASLPDPSDRQFVRTLMETGRLQPQELGMQVAILVEAWWEFVGFGCEL